ncbi:MAG TPA: hypothetical protein VIV37_01995 [Gaiellaceae bacterium]
MLFRLLIWNVAESRTSIDELRESLPDLDSPSRWIWNEVSDRFGALVFGDDLPETIGWAQDLVGSEPDVYEEFDSP